MKIIINFGPSLVCKKELINDTSELHTSVINLEILHWINSNCIIYPLLHIIFHKIKIAFAVTSGGHKNFKQRDWLFLRAMLFGTCRSSTVFFIIIDFCPPVQLFIISPYTQCWVRLTFTVSWDNEHKFYFYNSLQVPLYPLLHSILIRFCSSCWPWVRVKGM